MSLKCEPASEPQRFYQAAGGRMLLDDLLVRIHFIIVMVRWTGLAPFPFPGSLTSTVLSCEEVLPGGRGARAARRPRSAYRGTSIIRNSAPLGPYSRNMHRALRRP